MDKQYEKTKEILDKILERTKDGFIDYASSQFTIISNVQIEVLEDVNWENILYEPCIQVLYYADSPDEIEDVEQLTVTSFGQLSELSRFLILDDDIELLTRSFIKDFLSQSELATPLKIQEFQSRIPKMIDYMIELHYQKRYDAETSAAVFELTRIPEFASEEFRKIFCL